MGMREVAIQKQRVGVGADGFVEAETAAIEHHLIDVGTVKATQQAPDSFVLEDDRHAVEHTSVHFWSILLGLQLTLKLQAHLDCLKAVSYCDSAACCNTAGDKGTVPLGLVVDHRARVWRDYPMPVDMTACQDC